MMSAEVTPTAGAECAECRAASRSVAAVDRCEACGKPICKAHRVWSFFGQWFLCRGCFYAASRAAQRFGQG
jgi:hypothetical protein